MAGKSGDRFKAGELVFAKMKGFPHWPARICKSEAGYKKRVPVYFFGTHQIGSVPPENVVPYIGNKLKYGSGVRIKGFTEGMWEIQNSPGLGSKLKVGLSVVLCVWERRERTSPGEIKTEVRKQHSSESSCLRRRPSLGPDQTERLIENLQLKLHLKSRQPPGWSEQRRGPMLQRRKKLLRQGGCPPGAKGWSLR
uniref:PWWP domain-containing protein n=1 Tax=Nothobranchius furzeri TaxID=105023 RepID=A0A8C6LGP6_NOTFU